MNFNTNTSDQKELFKDIIERLRPPLGEKSAYPDHTGEYWALCPFHDEEQVGSFSFNEQGFNCHMCGINGSIFELGQKLGIIKDSRLPKNKFTGITLQDYSEAKKLPLDFLQSLQVHERNQKGVPQLLSPYFNQDGKRVGTRIRTSLNGFNSLLWAPGSRPTLYGLWWTGKPLQDCIINGDHGDMIILVDGETNAQTLWFYGFPALGVPDASTWKADWKDYLAGKKVYLWQEHDEDGTMFVRRIGNDIPDAWVIFPPDNRKDISECHIVGDNIQALMSNTLESAIPFSKIIDEETKKEIEDLSEKAVIIGAKDILTEVVRLCRTLGIVGEENTIQLIYLALTSRILDKPISMAIKGTSSVGKSYILEKVLEFFPRSAYFDISSMSDKALFFTEESFEHRFLIIGEAVGMSDEFISYLIRILLSEGQIKHMTVESTEHGNQGKCLEKKGPTGFITTTTQIQLHPENETRLVSIDISDDRDQTKQIMMKIAESSMGLERETPLLENFIDYQVWIEKKGNKKVVIRYAKVLAEQTRPSAVRLRRDFSVLLSLIKIIAILYQQQREIDANGSIVATLDDYALAYDLISVKINEGAESSIKPIIRETVAVVDKLLNSGDSSLVSSFIDKNNNRQSFLDNTTIANALGLDTSSTSRRLKQAIRMGYLENLETQKGKRSKIVLGKIIPEDDSILPLPEDLKILWEAQPNSSAIVQHQNKIQGENYE
jgi:hypothetical protein